MAGIVIVGGGLTGLAAAWALERLRQPYTLIEVKPRLGGSIATHREAGFVLDGAAFLLERYESWHWLGDLGLGGELARFGAYRDGDLMYFRGGSEMLVTAMSARLTLGTIMTRMAVSSIGRLADGGVLGVCLENGVMLPARAIVVTAPARYAAHMLTSLSSDAALILDEHRYDPIVRVSFGVHQLADGWMPPGVPNYVKFLHTFTPATLPGRIPAGGTLIRVGVRLNPAVPTPAAALDAARRLLPASVDPVVAWTHYWSEADSLTRHLPEHAAAMDALDAALPPDVVIAGSDYRAKRLDQQIEDGRAAARRVAAL
ncbi:MAG: FAD-dependent oxidoreductase [Chloroflexota bacterium]|nr:FAD-dependent oxidoreductase [Chloroflexota bacterium]